LPSISIAPRMKVAPRSANNFGGFAMFARAAARRSGTWLSFEMMRRARNGGGSLSTVIKLWMPSVSADA
jgi:hypothetical protein